MGLKLTQISKRDPSRLSADYKDNFSLYIEYFEHAFTDHIILDISYVTR